MENQIVNFMDAALENDKRFGYELALSQNVDFEKVVRIWAEKRFQVIKKMKDDNLIYKEEFLRAREFKQDKVIQICNLNNISYFKEEFRIKGFFDYDVCLIPDSKTDSLNKINIKMNVVRYFYIKIPEYLNHQNK